MRSFDAFIVAFIFLLGPSSKANSVNVTQNELSEARRWVAAKFEGNTQPRPDEGYLLPHLKSGFLERDLRQGHPLRIAAKEFAHGVHSPSVGTIQVHLPASGRRFAAVVGVDSNDLTYYSSLGRGHVVVTVEVSGKELFRSSVMREGLEGIPIAVDIGGSSDLVLRVSGAVADTQWDQADFAERR